MQNKFLIFVALASIILITWFQFADKPLNPVNEAVKDQAVVNHEIKKNIINREKLKQKSIRPLNVSEELAGLANELLPISPDELKQTWQEEYGCYVFGSETIKSEDELLLNECAHSLLTAHSYEEALWMQRQGYPSKRGLDKLKDKSNINGLRELANQNYMPAVALLAIDEIRNGQPETAVSLASTLVSYSNRQQTFPHRLHGEALIANDMGDLGVVDLLVASFLGDVEAGYIAHSYIGNNTVLAMNVVNNAHLRMSRYFNLPYEEYPADPRPVPNGG